MCDRGNVWLSVSRVLQSCHQPSRKKNAQSISLRLQIKAKEILTRCSRCCKGPHTCGGQAPRPAARPEGRRSVMPLRGSGRTTCVGPVFSSRSSAPATGTAAFSSSFPTALSRRARRPTPCWRARFYRSVALDLARSLIRIGTWNGPRLEKDSRAGQFWSSRVDDNIDKDAVTMIAAEEKARRSPRCLRPSIENWNQTEPNAVTRDQLREVRGQRRVGALCRNTRDAINRVKLTRLPINAGRS